MQGVISSLGIGSGLQLGQIKDDLVAAERRPTQLRLDRREADIQAELSALGSVQSLAADLESKAESVASASIGRSANSSSGDILRASAEADATAGNFQVRVSQLASAQSLASEGFASTDTVVGTGTLTLTVGGDDAVAIDVGSEEQTLAGIRDAINASGAAVDAAVVDDGSQQRLLLTSQRTGSANAIDLAVSDDDGSDTDAGGLSRLAFTAGAQNLTETAAASDAALSVNGLDVTRSGNSVDDVIPGVTLDLRSADSATTVDVRVEPDRSGVESAVQGLVEQYNKLADGLGEATRFDPESGEAGALVGDSATRSLLSGLRSTLVSGLGDSGTTLVELGIRTGADGRLEVDSETLDAALDGEPADTVAALNTAGSAIADTLGGFVGTDGRLDQRGEGLQNRLDDVADDRRRLDDRITALQDRLTAEFASLDGLVAEFQQTGDFLTRQLAQVPTPGQ